MYCHDSKNEKQDGLNQLLLQMPEPDIIPHRFFLILLLWIVISCNGKNTVQNNNLFIDQTTGLIEEYHKKGLFDGVILVGDLNGTVYKNAFGLANRIKRIPLTMESQFYLASVSKQFTASAILLLIQAGKIAPDDSVIKYIPELPEVCQSITFRNLLNHTSGIPDYYGFAEIWDGFTNSDVLQVLSGIDSLEFQPGSQYKYSNSGYVLLSVLVDRISGSRFSEFLKENLLDIAGLSETIVFDEYAEEPEHRVTGYGSDSSTTDYRFRTTGGGGIFSDVEDLYIWHRSLLSGNILKQEIILQAYQPARLLNDSLIFYGFGWRIDPEDTMHVWHDGDLEGFRTRYDRRLDNGKVIILLSNNSSDYLGEIAGKIWDLWTIKNKSIE